MILHLIDQESDFYAQNLVYLCSESQIMNDGHLFPSMQDNAAELIDDLVTQTEVILDDDISVV